VVPRADSTASDLYFLMAKGTGVPELHVVYRWLTELRGRLRTMQQ
jgi:hypothetical protein